MALLVWFTMGVALWHFTVFLPDHSGVGSSAPSSARWPALWSPARSSRWRRPGLGDTDLVTPLVAIPGAPIGLAVIYASACAPSGAPD